jgi:hypothetical protein
MCSSLQYQYDDYLQDPPPIKQTHTPLSLVTPYNTTNADATFQPRTSLLLVQMSEEFTSLDSQKIEECMPLNKENPSLPHYQVVRRTSLSFLPLCNEEDENVLQCFEEKYPRSLMETSLDSQKIEECMPLNKEMPSLPHYQVVRRTSLSLLPLCTEEDDNFLQCIAEEKDFDDGLDTFFRDRATATEPPQSFDQSAAFSDNSPLEHQGPSNSSADFAKNYETYFGTLVQRMKTSEKSRCKVAKIRNLIGRKWKQQLFNKELAATAAFNKEDAATAGSKTEHTRQMLLNSLIAFPSAESVSPAAANPCYSLPSYTAMKAARRKGNSRSVSTDSQVAQFSGTLPKTGLKRRRSSLALLSYKMQFFPDCS